MTSNWMKVHVLEGDGVVPALFQYLYKTDKALRGRHHALVSASTTNQAPSSPTTGDPTATVTSNTAGGLGSTVGASNITVTSATGGPALGTSATGVKRPLYTLPIPDTVIYDHNFPQAWYSYSRRDREMIKRPGRYLDAQHIYKGLCRVEPGSGGICAQFSCAVPDEQDPSITKTRVYYLNPPQLEEL